jgi:hypothetical protein
MAHPKHEQVRQRYQRRCGYCGVSEVDAGGELTVDHHRPVSAGGDDSDDNLVYACFRCNTYKGDFFPDAADARAGRRVLHPLLDPVALHLRENEGTGLLEPQTETGRFHIDLLRLNRPELVEHRLTRRLANLLATAHGLLREENEVLRRRLTNLEAYLRQMERYLAGGSDPEEGSSVI